MGAYAVLGVSRDIAVATRLVASAQGIPIKDLVCEALLANPKIFNAYREVLRSQGEDTSELKQTQFGADDMIDYLGGGR